ncbi:hypothetical protein PQX77_008936 [Marasmius sp. AFHP31]|nr:hypothetical protein PQX77_008936 [Marasmius sp. AFHP31]
MLNAFGKRQRAGWYYTIVDEDDSLARKIIQARGFVLSGSATPLILIWRTSSFCLRWVQVNHTGHLKDRFREYEEIWWRFKRRKLVIPDARTPQQIPLTTHITFNQFVNTLHQVLQVLDGVGKDPLFGRYRSDDDQHSDQCQSGQETATGVTRRLNLLSHLQNG